MDQPQPQTQPQTQPQQRQPLQRQGPNLPCFDLIRGPREEYLKFGVPLYEASINLNWKAAEAILVEKPELVAYSITENGETPLHVAASTTGHPKRMKEFVKNLVAMMKIDELELQNKNYNTALYLAATAGNVEIVKIMANKNRKLLTIPGAVGVMMPLYAAVLFGKKDVVECIYEESKTFSEEDGWSCESRGWLLEKCVENDMFEVALKIAKRYPPGPLYDSGRSVLSLLAGKPKAFRETKSSIMGRTIKSVFGFFGLKVGVHDMESALPLLRFIWGDIVKKPKMEIDSILRGPPDTNHRDSKTVSQWAVETMQLQKVITEHVEKMNAETQNIVSGSLSSSNQDNGSTSRKKDQALQLQKLVADCLVKMHVETKKIINDPSNSTMQDNKPVSNKEYLAMELQNLIFKHIADMHDNTLKIINTVHIETQASELQHFILEHIQKLGKESKEKSKKYQRQTYSSRVPFIAAKTGNTNFLVELIRGYPDMIWKVNDNNESIFHTAVKHRQHGIYNLLHDIGPMKDLIIPLRDYNDNNMWHLAAKRATERRLAYVPGVAFQMQLELAWFYEVKKMIPLSYRERENKDGLTAHELFTMEHRELTTLAEQWMKGTASQCMVVAALIATIVFAATFTVPGGYDQTNGIPIFHSKATFVVFVVADAIALISSSASILMFLSILTSRYAESDFLDSLPRKLLLGLATLFLSITTMMIAFGFSFFVLYHKGLLWIPILVCVLVVFPALLYVRLQFRLFIDVIRSTYRSRFLFNSKKSVLYYKNPKF